MVEKEATENLEADNAEMFKGLSAAQKKKLKAKLKKEAEDKAAAGGGGDAQPEATTAPQEESKQSTEAGGDDQGDDDNADMFKGMSAAQKKKAKAKLKADAAAKANAEQPKPATAAAGGKDAKKPKNAAAVARIQEMQRLKEAAEAEERRIREEEEAAIRAEEEAEKEKQRQIEEAANKKKADKQAKIQELKDKGEYLTKKQIQQKKDAEARRKAFEAAAGVSESPADEKEAEEQQPVKSIMVKKDKKKKNQQQAKAEEEKKAQELADQNDSGEEEDVRQEKKKVDLEETKQEVEENKEIDLGDDWEDLDLDEIASKIAVGTESQGVGAVAHDSDDSEEEAEKAKAKQKAAAEQQQKKQNQSGKAQAVESGGNNVFDRKISESNKARLEALRAQKRGNAGKAKKLRCPIICIMGHVDTGKTKILDKLRKTNVQLGEAGGITQQIGATYFPTENLEKHLSRVEHRAPLDLEIPGFLVIDTPGHESFTNLRSRGSSLCDMAVLVVDIMHGLEQQTLESIQLLRQKNTPFCIALNKIDRLNQWDAKTDACTLDTLDSQNKNAQRHFQGQLEKTRLAFAEQSLNVDLYWENESVEDTLSLVPTSAITGEGLSDLMYYLCKMGQTSEREKLTEKDQFECTVLEVKVIEGHGTTIDVVLVNGLLKVGDTIVISGMNGPIQTNIRALLTPQPMKEMRVKGEYQHHQKIKGAMGIKISAPGMELALPGQELFRCNTDQEIQDAKMLIDDDIQNLLQKFVDPTSDGVLVQASTIGALEALLQFLKDMKIPVSGVNIGPVHRKDVLKASKAMNQEKVKKEFATILAFDVKVVPDAQAFADENNIKIFTAAIIYHLFDSFTEYVEKCVDERKNDAGNKAVFPCILQIVPDTCFNRVSPIIVGVNVLEGELRIGTPLCIPTKDNLRLGTVASIESNKKPINSARLATGSVAVKIVSHDSIMFGRQFDDSNQIVSLITRDSIELLKENYRDEMKKEDWFTVIKLKKVFGIY